MEEFANKASQVRFYIDYGCREYYLLLINTSQPGRYLLQNGLLCIKRINFHFDRKIQQGQTKLQLRLAIKTKAIIE